ncbi:MAG: putative NADP-reducing hydrogenase, 51 kDa subunit [Holophagaceae bacterium]|nr:putative NADP-reducing hydrogenase, 51 kDa subunit [Holophagaceae bacterium]
MSLEIITPSSGSTLFTETKGFPALQEALIRGRVALQDQTGWKVDKSCLVVRAFDADPGAAIQATILSKAPGALLEGLAIAAFTSGATKAIIALATPSEALSDAIPKLQKLLPLEIEVRAITPSYMAGEDCALLQLLAGKSAMAGGADQPSTLVVNADELARLASGSRNLLVQVLGAVKQEAVVEAHEGTTLRQLIFEQCGGMKGEKGFKFALVGGPTGSFIPEAGLDVPAPSGTILVGDESACTVDMAQRCLTFTSEENCGRCVLCREGSYQLKEILSDMASGKTRPDDEAQIQELTAALLEGSLCKIGPRIADPLLTGLKHFTEEFEAHMKRKRCPALVCRKYVTFHILGEKCTGCGKCLGVCPEEAIEGEEDYIHVIDAKACTQCGLCFEICPEGAIVKAGPLKPKTPKEPIPVGTWKKR